METRADINGVPSIAVVTFTCHPRRPLLRCIESVRRQLGRFRVRHYVFHPFGLTLPEAHCDPSSVHYVPYEEPGDFGPLARKMAGLRSWALGRVEESYVCFLDDDNAFAEIHLATLLGAMTAKGVQAAHSLRYLVYPDGSLFAGDHYPWHPDPNEADRIYDWCIVHGVIRPGECVVYDGPVNSADPRNVSTVDMNEWVFDRRTLSDVGFDTDFGPTDVARNVGEDDKLLKRLLREGVAFCGTGFPTLQYRLGGFSNRFNDSQAGTGPAGS